MVNRAADALLARIVQRHAGTVADLGARLVAAGFGSARAPSWETLPTVAPRAKAELDTLQRQRPDFGGLAPAGLQPETIYWSPGGLMEPRVAAHVECLAALLREAGFSAGDRVANGFAYHFTPAGLLVHEALQRLGATVLPIGPQHTAQAAEFIAAAGATGYVGIASHLKALMSAVDALPAALPRPRLKRALAGAEPFGDAIRREIEARWGITCHDFYGTAEAGIVALECAAHQGVHLHPEVLAELVEPGRGERSDGPIGELLLSADADELPLLRFATGDLVRIDAAPCTCGRTTPRLRVLGRVGDSARVRGMLLHASQLRAFAAAAGLLACRVELTRDEGRDHIALHWRASLATDEGLLADAFRDHCRLRADRFAADASLVEGAFELVDERRETVT